MKTENSHSSEKASKNAQSPSRPVHDLLGGKGGFPLKSELSTFDILQQDTRNPSPMPLELPVQYLDCKK